MTKEEFKETRVGMALLVLKRMRNTDYQQWFRDYSECHTMFKFEEYGQLNDGKALFVINNFNPSSGFFYSWCEVCRGLMVAERYGLIPVVDWSNGPYYDKEGKDGFCNPFEFFFEPVSSVSLSEALQSRNVAFYNMHTCGAKFTLYDYRTEEEINRFARFNVKYLHIREELYSRLQTEVFGLIGKKRTLAVHVRGVEWGHVRNHPIPVSLEEYVNKIDKAMPENGFEQIFLATDSEDTVSFFKERYGEMIVSYNGVNLAKRGSKVLAIFDKGDDEKHKGFQLGYEVLRDMLTLSFSDGLIAGLSYVSFAAEVYKKGRGEHYQFKSYVDMKINKKGISANALPNYCKKGLKCQSKKNNH